jgi:hypothetical protein
MACKGCARELSRPNLKYFEPRHEILSLIATVKSYNDSIFAELVVSIKVALFPTKEYSYRVSTIVKLVTTLLMSETESVCANPDAYRVPRENPACVRFYIPFLKSLYSETSQGSCQK